MKTKIKTISPNQNIIEHESGLKTVFVEGDGHCTDCIYGSLNISGCNIIPCFPRIRDDKKDGNFIKLLEQ